jgi:apolipoprotein N-acyltransferase
LKAAGLAIAIALDACLAAAIAPPYGRLWLHVFVWAIAVALLGRVGPAGGFALGWLGGGVMHLALFAWLPETVAAFVGVPLAVGGIVWVLHAAIAGAFLGVVGLGLSRVRRGSGSLWPFGVAAWIAACECFALQAVPFHQGDAWYAVPALYLVTALTGPAGASFLVIAVNLLVLEAAEWLAAGRPAGGGRVLARNAALGLALLAGAFAWSSARLAAIAEAEASARTIRVAIVPSVHHGRERRALLRGGDEAEIARDLVRRSREALAAHGPIDAFVWPEGALPDEPLSFPNLAALELARESGAEIWTGAAFPGRDRDAERRPFNAAFRIDAGGLPDRRYDKRILVPFGEYVPFSDRFPALARIPGLGREIPGTHGIVYDAAPARFAFLICYEAIFGSLVREAWRDGSDLLVNVTFDGWLGEGAAPEQHLALAAMRSAQFGIPMVRAAGRGISAVVDARGVIVARSRDTEEALVAEVAPLRVAGPYAAFGDWFGWSCLAVSAVVLVRGRAPARRSTC